MKQGIEWYHRQTSGINSLTITVPITILPNSEKKVNEQIIYYTIQNNVKKNRHDYVCASCRAVLCKD